MCSFEESSNTFNSVSEPSTPKKTSEKRERRSGLSGLAHNFTSLEDNKFFSTHHLWKKSEKGLLNSATSAIGHGESTKENYFDFNNCETNLDLPSNSQEPKLKETASLSHVINIVLKPWLDFGHENLRVPSLKKYTFRVVLRNSIPTIMKEFNSSITIHSPDMNIHLLMATEQGYCEFDLTQDGCFEDSNNLMILLRHGSLWNTKFLNSYSENSFTKLYQKLKNEKSKLCFPPTFSSAKSMSDSSCNLNMSDSKSGIETEWQMCIAPRQKFLLLYVEERYITLYLYNWSSSYSSSIVTLFSNLIIWHNSRSLLMQSLIMQKAGIFHHLPFKRYSFEEILALSNVNYKDMNLSQFFITPSTFNSKDKTNFNIFKNTDLLLKHPNPFEAFKDFKENKDALTRSDFIFDSKNYSYIFSNFESNSAKNLFDCLNGQFNSNYNTYIKDLKDLSKVWQLHGAKLNYPVMEKITGHVKKYGRLNHFCLTPFLFSHKWRYYISLIRDHTMPINAPRSRHLSGGHVLRTSSEHEFIISKRSRRKSGPPNMLEFTSTMPHRNNSLDDCLDIAVCPHYIQEYVQYLQSLGFSSIKSPKAINLTINKKSFETDRRNDKFKTGVPFSRKTSYKNDFDKFYSIKTLLGGFFLFEIGFCEPYVYSYLYSFDSARFSAWIKSDSFNSHMNTTNFLDELDSIKMRMHLHSFTYDYHLRAIHSYISGRQLFFHQGYHLISFLDDFIKYYQKAPNYARNHVYSDHIKFESTRISADQLYNYIINHNKLYGLEVFQMNSPSLPDRMNNELNREYVLIHLSSHRIPYIDENKIRQEDNFDLGVLITYQKLREVLFVKDNNLCLKFFVLLTSQRELFPKLFPFGDNKGSFRTIRLLSSNTSNCQTRKNSLLGEASENSLTPKLPPTTTSIYNSFNRSPFDNLSPDPSSAYSGICDEKINYLGYFHAHEIVMLKILNEKVNETKEQLKKIITLAEIDCKRDRLWNSLIPNGGVVQIPELAISLDEFNELLVLVKSIRLDEYDQTLNQFYSFNHSWYKGLAQKLELKFEFTHRKFYGKDVNHCKMAFFKTNCKDCFILFDIRNSIPYVDFKIVFKKSPQIEINEAYLQSCNPQYHELVEDFINACTSYMWSVML